MLSFLSPTNIQMEIFIPKYKKINNKKHIKDNNVLLLFKEKRITQR